MDKESAPVESHDDRVDILNLAGWSVLDEHEEEHFYQFTVQIKERLLSCPFCQTDMIPYKFGERPHTFVDLPMHGKQVRLLARQRRYRCRNCHKTFLDPAPHMSELHSATLRLVNHIERETLSMSSRTFLSLAHEIGMTEDTVRHIFDSCVKALERAHTLQAPATLGIDELFLLGTPRCILTDLTRRNVVDLLPNRNQETVIRWLRQLPGKEHIEVVAMDMWQPYRNAVREVLPQASIVVDKFHVVKLANGAIEQVRKTVRSSLSDKQRRTLMHDRFILLRRRKDLKEKDVLILETWIENFPVLGAAYILKEAFYEIWEAPTQEEAHNRYWAWFEQITPEVADAFVPIALTVENWGDEIFAYFSHNGTITNAFTEATNGVLKVSNRVGRGYSFSVIRAKILFAGEITQKYPRSQKRFQPKNQTEKEQG
jgi:transposase